MIAQQGGDPCVVDDYTRLPSAPLRHTVRADRAGYVTRLDAELVGRAAMVLGAGRERVDDRIDFGVGATINGAYSLDRHARVGSLEPGKQMDAVVVDGPAIDLVRVGAETVRTVLKNGRIVFQSAPIHHEGHEGH